MTKIEHAFLPAAILGLCAVGFYACRLWEMSLKLKKHKLYVESTVKLIESGLTFAAR
jgi:hypothetical protein